MIIQKDYISSCGCELDSKCLCCAKTINIEGDYIENEIYNFTLSSGNSVKMRYFGGTKTSGGKIPGYFCLSGDKILRSLFKELCDTNYKNIKISKFGDDINEND